MFYTIFFFLCATAPFSEPLSVPWGADSELVEAKKQNVSASNSTTLAQKACVGMIHFFQKRISPIDGPRSHYTPTSSQYTLLAIQKYGVFKGIALGCDRLLRENGEAWIYPVKEGRKQDPVR